MNPSAPSVAVSGPRVARLFVCALAVLWLVAWWSWGIQVLPLVGSGGVAPLIGTAHWPVGATAAWPALAQTLAPYLTAPFGDALLLLAVGAGVVAATAAACGLWPRRCLAVSAGLYAAFVAAAPSFFPCVGDKLLLEASVLALLLPRNRPAPAIHLLARAMVLKLYLGMGLAQWLAAGNGWQRGSALRELLQNAPLPTPSGWWLGHLPAPLLVAATKATLLVELCVPWLAFGSRRVRLTAALVLTALQLAVANLINDGLFAFVATALHLFLLNDADVLAMRRDVARLGAPAARAFDRLTTPVAAGNLPGPWPARREAVSGGLLAVYLLTSGVALFAAVRPRLLAGAPGSAAPPPPSGLLASLAPVHLGYTYTHAGTPLPQRVEPIVEVLSDGHWQALELWHEPGDPWRAPRLVVPHQPRLDAQLAAAGRALHDPAAQRVVHALAARLCRPAAQLQRLLRTPVPPRVQRVRVHYDGYRFADWAQHRATGVWWTRAQVGDGMTIDCAAEKPTDP